MKSGEKAANFFNTPASERRTGRMRISCDWNYLKLEVTCLREYAAIVYYKVNGWM